MPQPAAPRRSPGALLRALLGALPSGGWVGVLVVVTVIVRLPFLGEEPSSDEAGFLMVAEQWARGEGSLYGGHFVDRPPLLIMVFVLADLLGGLPALRVLGCVVAAATVAVAGGLGRVIGGPRSEAVAAVVAATFVSTKLFDAQHVSGELVAAPFVLAGVTAWVVNGGRSRLWCFSAGACAAAAVLVKQSFVDVFVFVLAYALVGARYRVGARRSLPVFAAGAAVVLTAVVAGAAALGTSPIALWQAVVLFRLDAAGVIASSATSDTWERAIRFPGLLLVSGAAVLIVLALVAGARRRREPLAAGALALLAWELVVVLLTGSYWVHNLVALVPGMVLGAALATAPAPGRSAHRLGRITVAVSAYAVAVSVLVTGFLAVSPEAATPSQAAGEWLGRAKEPGDEAVVLYGKPELLLLAGTPSPYEHLWSLPVRVLDPELAQLTAVLSGPRAPDWLLVKGGLDTWGVRSAAASSVVERRYRAEGVVCGYVIHLRADLQRDLDAAPAPATCG